MKNLKTLATILLTLTMLFALTACGGTKESKDPIADVAETYNLDLTSSDVQEMSADRAESATLSSLVHDYFEDVTFFSGTDKEKLTYNDLKEQIGVDASNYYLDGSRHVFTWIASDDEVRKFAAWFGAEGELYAIGSSNL